MTTAKLRFRMFTVAIICFTHLALSAFYHHIDKYLTGWLFIFLTVLIPITFVAILIYAIYGLIEIYRNRLNLTFHRGLPTIIVLLTLLYIFFSPWSFDSEYLESKVKIRACYEGTQNQSYIKFREDSTFEINSTGVFFADFWYTGQWTKSGDTIFMKFDGERPNNFSDTLVIHKDHFIPASKINLADSLNDYRRFYYLGYCKGLN
jgi:hypothetical protein